jgi:predicted RNA-binding Zn-ribbon protein involved in translation (DUF1610 family)
MPQDKRDSRTCSACGYKLDESLPVTKWTCPKCGAHHDDEALIARQIIDQTILSVYKEFKGFQQPSVAHHSLLLEKLAEWREKAGEKPFACYNQPLTPWAFGCVAPSVLCIAQEVSKSLGMGDWGLRFHVPNSGEERNQYFLLPLVVEETAPLPPFHRTAPFVKFIYDTLLLQPEYTKEIYHIYIDALRFVAPDLALEQEKALADAQAIQAEMAAEATPDAAPVAQATTPPEHPSAKNL